jgi:hypothetical protein
LYTPLAQIAASSKKIVPRSAGSVRGSNPHRRPHLAHRWIGVTDEEARPERAKKRMDLPQKARKSLKKRLKPGDFDDRLVAAALL